MNQFKPIFLGQADPRSEQAKLKRAANSQKCIRAGGKHNDLDDVGKDTYHHTFFEMLGNWSFGNYFKREAITWAWELLTEVYKLDTARIYASYFGGAPDKGLEPDNEAKAIWCEFLPADRVLPFGMKENFWEMGDTGPCGPCSEIHFDKIEGRTGSQHLVNADDPTLIEIWNLVFIQYNREADKSLRQLPAKHVDTGMGLERLTSIIQKVGTNYDTDVFMPIFAEIQRVTKFSQPYGGKVGKDDPNQVDMAYRVIADHIRTLTFSLADGAVPSSDGRGSVLRRILRRAIRYGKQKLNAPSGFFHCLVDVVLQNFGDFFPELRKRPQHIISVIETEEKMFERTLDKGIIEFENIAKKSTNGVISANHAWYLSSSFGFPIDLTTLMAEEKGMKVDIQGYEALSEKLAEENRKRQKEKKNELTLNAEPISILQKMDVHPTKDQYKYEQKEVQTVVKAIWTGSEFINSLVNANKKMVGVVLESTNFYPEQGGQIFDIGNINFTDTQNTAFQVTDCKVFGGYVLHIGYISDDCAELKVGDRVETTVDYTRRIPIMSNHTSTHMVNFALRKVVGENVDQRGSLVDQTRLRFDFSIDKSLNKDQLVQVDAIVNELIAKQLPVHSKEVELDMAKKIYGLRAVFGEVYPNPVRVVSVGVDVNDLITNPSNPDWANYSIEFCGGTHLTNSKEAEFFTIVSEEAVAAGVRRIFAVTGSDASVVFDNNRKLEDLFNEAKKLTGKDLKDSVPKLLALLESHQLSASKRIELQATLNEVQNEVKKWFKVQEQQQLTDAKKVVTTIIEQLKESKAPVFAGEISLGLNNSAITDLIKEIQTACPDTAVLFVSPDEEKKKVCVLSIVPPKSTAATKGLTANSWVVKVSEVLGGKGGGKVDVAQGVGSSIEKVDEAIQLAKSFGEKLLL
ncbi:hypothetical protein SAMD00019534_048670 [Acytostelium subglobosum LB1]|uniref:hypothetical protein n=1 Tax=Acytostelium subglobosum LB1 TaxID=1410327 RepID=UPI0006448208|nr:hypothetical protein SAMD00019534_048670 [Acytostelium subglobosum LB1]GAM21692.1 hypothetical protein SAMD00019534_048670 [Acytostelium subglobosum LB1]|eukprot:XP_012755811.1 hypothetical protein SAMD00019534_048670 [Acytostelium subglobosum LB1]